MPEGEKSTLDTAGLFGMIAAMVDRDDVVPAKGDAGKKARRGGRPPSARAIQYTWYFKLENFDSCGRGDQAPWWERKDYLDWEREPTARKSERSNSRGKFEESLKLPGFLWETVRRTPEALALIDGLGRLDTSDEVQQEMSLEQYLPISEAQSLLRGSIGQEAFEAAEILRRNWRKSFDSLDHESQAWWRARYLAFWHLVGKPGTVPAASPAFPNPDGRSAFSGEQWRTAFDLLAEDKTSHDAVSGYASSPLPGVLLQRFAKLKPPSDSLAERMNPVSRVLPGKTCPESYPWVSMGILTKRLNRNHMQPLLLAVDLSRTTETIVRDIKAIIDQKRVSQQITVTDRRIKMESFRSIRNLDADVIGGDGGPPQSTVVKAFERAAQLDLIPLVSMVGEFVARVRPDTEGADRIKANVSFLL